MKFPTKSVPSRILFSLVVAIVVVVVIHLVLQAVNLLVFQGKNYWVFELSNRLDLDDEESVPTWLSQFLLLGLSAMTFLVAYLEKARIKKITWSTIGVVALIFSIDEVATLHEYVLTFLHANAFGNTPSTLLKNGWILALPFILVSAITLAFFIYRTMPRRTFGLFVLSGGVFLFGAVGIELVTNAIHFSDFMNQGVLVAAEEGGEMLGVALAIFTTADYLSRYYGTTMQSVARALKT